MRAQTNTALSDDIGNGEREVTATAAPVMVGNTQPSRQRSRRTTQPTSRRDALEILQTAFQDARGAGIEGKAVKVRGETTIVLSVIATQCAICKLWRTPDDMATETMCQHCASAGT